MFSDEDLGKQVGFLIIELQLCIKQPDKALSLITYLHNQILNGTNNIKSIKPKVNEKEQKEKKVRIITFNLFFIFFISFQLVLNPGNELFLKKLAKYKARCYLMNHSIEAVRNEMQHFIQEKLVSVFK